MRRHQHAYRTAFAFAQAQFHFYTPLLEIQLERHQCVPLQFDLLLQMANLAFMRQQAAGAAGIFIKDIPLLIWADVHAFQDDLTIINICPGILQVDPAGTQAFDLGADQFNAGSSASMTKYSWRASRFGQSPFAGLFLCHQAHLLSKLFSPATRKSIPLRGIQYNAVKSFCQAKSGVTFRRGLP